MYSKEELDAVSARLWAAVGRVPPMSIAAVLAHKTGAEPKKYWHGSEPTVCDLSGEPITDTFYDCSVPRFNGSWGNLCPASFTRERCALGQGKGQRYEKQADGRWLKTGG